MPRNGRERSFLRRLIVARAGFDGSSGYRFRGDRDEDVPDTAGPRYGAVSPQRAQRVTLSNARGGPPNQDAPPCFALVIDLIDLEGDPSSVCERSQRPVPGGAEDDHPVPVPVCHRENLRSVGSVPRDSAAPFLCEKLQAMRHRDLGESTCGLVIAGLAPLELLRRCPISALSDGRQTIRGESPVRSASRLAKSTKQHLNDPLPNLAGAREYSVADGRFGSGWRNSDV